MRNIWLLRLATFGLWALAAASVAYWLLQTTGGDGFAPALAGAETAGAKFQAIVPDTDLVAKGLGAVGPAADPHAGGAGGSADLSANRFALLGIMAQGGAQDGLVMLSVDGKPVQLLRVGATVAPHIVIQALSSQSVTLANTAQANAAPSLTLTLGQKTAAAPNAAAATPAAIEKNAARADANGGGGAALGLPEQTPPVQTPPSMPSIPLPPPTSLPAPAEARQARPAGEMGANTANNRTANQPSSANANATPSPAAPAATSNTDSLYFKNSNSL